VSDVFEFEGTAYVRPVGRGVDLFPDGAEVVGLEEAVEGHVESALGRYVSGDWVRLRISVEFLGEAVPREYWAPSDPSEK
jgi:hypothetical protein